MTGSQRGVAGSEDARKALGRPTKRKGSPRAKATPKPKPKRSKPSTYAITPGIRRAIGAAEWITVTDEGATKLALRMAKELDEAAGARDASTAANSLLRILSALGLTVEGRPADADDETDAVDSIRASVADLGKHRAANRNAANS